MSRTCSGTKPFSLSAPATRQIYADAYERTRALYCRAFARCYPRPAGCVSRSTV